MNQIGDPFVVIIYDMEMYVHELLVVPGETHMERGKPVYPVKCCKVISPIPDTTLTPSKPPGDPLPARIWSHGASMTCPLQPVPSTWQSEQRRISTRAKQEPHAQNRKAANHWEWALILIRCLAGTHRSETSAKSWLSELC